MAGGVLLEVCIESVADAKSAEAGGTDRLELNSALSLGGLTPSLGTLIEVRAATRLPIVVMARPRAGGFCYDDDEFRVLRRDAELALGHGAEGIAFGVLTPERAIDVVRCRQLVEQIGAARCVFHRAFDFTCDPVDALNILIDLGVRRVMTSGQQRTAGEGSPLIAELIRRGAGRVEIIPAGGIRPWNVGDLVDRTGCDQVHASLRERKDDEGQSPSGLSLSDIPVPQSVTSEKLVQEMVLLLAKRHAK